MSSAPAGLHVITVAVSTDTETPLVFMTGEDDASQDFLVTVEDDLEEAIDDSLEKALETLREAQCPMQARPLSLTLECCGRCSRMPVSTLHCS